jgi:hypothetical protein
MEIQEFEQFVDGNKNIEWQYDGDTDAFMLRDTNTPYYVNHPDACTVVSGEAMKKINPEDLVSEINRGLKVEGITRITGYFARVNSFNPGKKGELRDRDHVRDLQSMGQKV